MLVLVLVLEGVSLCVGVCPGEDVRESAHAHDIGVRVPACMCACDEHVLWWLLT